MSTWYKTNRWQNTITTVEVVKETPQYVVLAPNRWHGNDYRLAKGHKYFPTFAEARKDLMDYFKGVAESNKVQMEKANTMWGKLFLQEEPDKENQ